MSSSIQSVSITTDSIHLDQLLKWMGLSETGGQSRILIDNGSVLVNGIVIRERRRKINPGDMLNIEGQEYLIVSEVNQINAR